MMLKLLPLDLTAPSCSSKPIVSMLLSVISKTLQRNLNHPRKFCPAKSRHSTTSRDSENAAIFIRFSARNTQKAFAHAFVDASDHRQGTALLINVETNAMTIGSQGELVVLIVQRLYKNASLMSAIADLHHGSSNPGKDSLMSMACLSWIRQFSFQPYANLANVSSSFLAERIVSMNGFGCLISCRISHIRCTSNEGRHETANEKFDFRGLWPTASYINHSCYSNVRQSFIGDMMIVMPREISRRILKSSSGTSHLLVTLNNK